MGKTTLLRDVTRLLADQLRRRVVVVDTSNEIAGDAAQHSNSKQKELEMMLRKEGEQLERAVRERTLDLEAIPSRGVARGTRERQGGFVW